MRKKIMVLVAYLVLVTAISNAQEIVDYEKLRIMTKEQINAINPLINAKYDVAVYKILYTTKKLDLSRDTASGIMCVPQDNGYKYPFLIYDHGTANDRHSVPSEKTSDQTFPAIYASKGYICVAPDYIGMGVSKGIHPYIHPESEAWAGIDLLKACKTIGEKEDFHYNEQIFVTGYSQGGHASMATCRALKEEPDLQLTAGAPMSGPYSVSKVMFDFTMGDKEYFFCGYLGSILVSIKHAYPDLMADYQYEDLLKPEYASIVRRYEREEIGVFDMNTEMVTKLQLSTGKVLPKYMFKDSVFNAMLTNAEHPVRKALKRMDVCDWLPDAPLAMFYCKADEQVTYRNAIYTDSLMKAKGAENVKAVDVNPNAGHGQCVFNANVAMMAFFGSMQRIDKLSATSDFASKEIQVFPNPAVDKIYVEGVDAGKNMHLSIYSLDGVLIKPDLSLTNGYIDVSLLQRGGYILKIENGNSTVIKRFLIMR